VDGGLGGGAEAGEKDGENEVAQHRHGSSVKGGLTPSMGIMYVLMQQQMDMHVLAQRAREC
jgi:hypothetical protein